MSQEPEWEGQENAGHILLRCELERRQQPVFRDHSGSEIRDSLLARDFR